MKILVRIALLALLLVPAVPLHAQSAAERVEAVYWEGIRASKDPADFRAYLEQYPNGRFAAEARERLGALEQAASAQPADNMPRTGDQWTYRLLAPKRTDGPKEQSYVVQVKASAPPAITEQLAIDGRPAGEWTHKGERHVVSLGLSLFSPYLLAHGLPPQESFGRRVPVVEPACSGNYICEASARIVRTETIRVPAGTFDCIKVEVEHSWRPAYMSGISGAQLQGARKLSVWYAYAAKRAVKFSSRTSFGGYPPVETDFDLELVSYKLN